MKIPLKLESLRLLEENILSALRNRAVGKRFLNRIQFAKELGPQIDKWELIKIKSFCTKKNEASNLVKRKVTG